MALRFAELLWEFRCSASPLVFFSADRELRTGLSRHHSGGSGISPAIRHGEGVVLVDYYDVGL